jgi:hypothetical protein
MGQSIEPPVARPAGPAELMTMGAFVAFVGLLVEPPARDVVPIAGVLLAVVGFVGGILKGARRAVAFQRPWSIAVAIALFGLACVFLVAERGIEPRFVAIFVGTDVVLALYFVEKAREKR